MKQKSDEQETLPPTYCIAVKAADMLLLQRMCLPASVIRTIGQKLLLGGELM